MGVAPRDGGLISSFDAEGGRILILSLAGTTVVDTAPSLTLALLSDLTSFEILT